MSEPADLELSLSPAGAAFDVELRFSKPGSDAQAMLLPRGRTTISINQKQLLELELDPAAYGRYLSQQLFGQRDLAVALAKVRAVASALGAPLRLRITSERDLHAAHGIRWETLYDPEDDAPLISDSLFLVREVPSANLRPSRPIPRGDVRALVAVAAPDDLAERGLYPIDPAREAELAIQRLAPIPATILSRPQRVTPASMLAGLRDGATILYLVAHGKLRDNEGYLLLEDEAGRIKPTPVSFLATVMAGLTRLPRLVVLVACQSAGSGRPSDLAALASRLAAAGIPAVLAMQGDIAVSTVQRFLPHLFSELLRDDRIDRAVAAARTAIRDDEDWWRPALYMRARDSRLWIAEPLRVLRPRAPLVSAHELTAFDWRRDEELLPAIVACLHGCTALTEISAREALVAALPQAVRERASLQRQADPLATLVEACADLPWGVERLIDLLRAREGPSLAMEALDAALARRIPQPIASRSVAALREALAPVALDEATLRERFIGVAGPDLRLPDYNAERGLLACALDIVARQPRPGEGRHPLLRFVARLLPGLDPAVAGAAQARLAAIAAELGEEVPEEAGTAPSAPAPPLALLIELKPTVDARYQVRAWCWGSDLSLIAADDTSYTLAEVRGPLLLRIFDSMADQLIAAGDDLTIEFFLPATLLAEAVDQWELDGDPLGFRYRVMVRSQERADLGSKRLWGRWHQRWGQLKALATRGDAQSVAWVCTHDECRDRLLRVRLEQAAVLALACELPSAAEIRSALINVLLRAGTPVALWPRTLRRPAGDLTAELSVILQGDAPLRLPEQIYAWRRDAYAASEGHLGQHLTLFWDDPERLPQAQARYNAPEAP